MKKGKILLFFFLVTISTFGQYKESFHRDILFAEETNNYLEGYVRSTGLNDFSYHSFREDITESLLTRCTNGRMSIQWETSKVPENIDSGCGFIWMAAMDLTEEECRFDMYVNGIKRFEIFSGTEPELKVVRLDGGNLGFYPVDIDHHGDLHGYMTLDVPSEWVSPGRPLEIKITGSNSESNTWIIVYKATDALSYLQQKAMYSIALKASFTRNDDSYDVLLYGPECFSGTKLEISAGEEHLSRKLIGKNNRSELSFNIGASNLEDGLVIKDKYGELVNIRSLNDTSSKLRFLNKSVLINDIQAENNHVNLEARRLYRPKTGSTLLKLSRSQIKNGTIYLMNSSHQDIAWMDSPGKCVIDRDTMLLNPLFQKALVSDSYRFDIEDALMLKEYISRHPEKKELIGYLLNEGRISCGSSFVQPYEEMYSGEALARQFYFGARWLKEEFDYDANIYWNVDVPGRTLQMPQILKKAGIEYMVFSRFEKGLYNWYAPDSSFITAYSPGHYANAYLPLQRSFFEAARYISDNALSWSGYYSSTANPVIPLLSDWDMSPARDYNQLVDMWARVSEIENENGVFENVRLPEFHITTADVFFKALSEQADNIPSIRGERPAVWLYIHGPSHYQAIKASREADILLTKVEKYNSALAAVKGSFEFYPAEELNAAWEAKIYPDHGWGGKEGDITDNLFLMKFMYASSEARRLLHAALFALSAEIEVQEKYGTPLVVFNSMNGDRTDFARVDLVFPRTSGNALVLKDEYGEKIPSQLTGIIYNSDGTLHSGKLVFLASDVPSLGYKTYYYDLINEENIQNDNVNPDIKLSNSYYDIILGPRGIEYLYDKDYNEVVIDSDRFAGGEIITMNSVGNGAGEFSDIQQPDMKDYDFTGSCGDSISWEIIEDGEILTRLKIRQPVKYAEIEREITIYHNKKKIDLDISILNWEGKLYREFRMVMPMNQKNSDINYQVPFGVMRVGKDELDRAAGERYTTLCSDVHPRGIQNWISSNSSKFGFTMSSDVVVVDYIDPLDNGSDRPILQAVLLASRRSCHELGNEYLQTGDHHFHFSFTSHKSGWENGYSFGIGSNEKLDVVRPYLKSVTASLPESMSFFSAENSNIIISTVKKAEDENALVARLYEIEGRDTDLSFKMFRDIANACRTNLIEYRISEVNSITRKGFNTRMGKYSIDTFKLNLDDTE